MTRRQLVPNDDPSRLILNVGCSLEGAYHTGRQLLIVTLVDRYQPVAAGWIAQTNPPSHGGPPGMTLFKNAGYHDIHFSTKGRRQMPVTLCALKTKMP